MGKVFRKIHIELSLFFLPLALLYVISGALYLSGFNQDSGAKIWNYSLPLMKTEEIGNAISHLLKEEGLPPISSLESKKGKGGALIFGSASYNAEVREKKGKLQIRIVERSFWGNLIMLHKGKAKWYFDVLAFAFAFSLIIFYLSGLIMTSFCNRRRKQAFLTFGLGLTITLIVGYLSLI